jgi:hypothetical protein
MRFPSVTEYTPYAGIGSRETPASIMMLMGNIARTLADRGYTLRSGGAPGADQAFEFGTPVMVQMEIYVPWHGFMGRPDTMSKLGLNYGEARSIAEKFHPRWNYLSESVRKIMTRNTFQVLGPNCHNLSKFIVCWTKDGKASGGTGQALRIADAQTPKIPIYNLYDPEVRIMFYKEFGWEYPE